MRWSERRTAARPYLRWLPHFNSEQRAPSSAVAHLVLVRRKEPMHDILRAIRQRPALLLGDDPDARFTRLDAFILGYQTGFATARPDLATSEQPSLVTRDFTRFVTEHYGRSFPDSGRGWQTFIREHSRTEQEAFDLFFQLLEQYDRTTTPSV